MMTSSTIEVWFHRHNGVDLVGGASSVEFALPSDSSGAIATPFSIRLKDIREAARAQNSRSIGKYDSAEIILLHYNNRDVAPNNLSDYCLNPGQVYDANVHGGTYNEPIIFRIVPEENMSYLAPSTIYSAALVVPSTAIESYANSRSAMSAACTQPRASLPLALPPTSIATAEMNDSSVATFGATACTITTSTRPKTVVHCGQGHANEPGNIDYTHALQRHQPAYLNGRTVRDAAKCNGIVDQIMEQFEFHQDGHVLKDEAARIKVKQQLSYRRATTLPAQQKLDSQSPPQRILVSCGPGHVNDSGNLDYVRILNRHRPAYVLAMDARDTGRCKSIINKLLNFFEFLDRDGHLLPPKTARLKVRNALNDRTQLRRKT